MPAADLTPDTAGSEYGRWLVSAAAFVLILHLGGVTNKWSPTPDSALYLSLGRSLAQGEGFHHNGEACTTVGPGLPAILALVHPLGIWGANFLMALFGLAALGFAYTSISRLANRHLALAAVVCTGLSYTFYDNAHRVLTDIPFAATFMAIFLILTLYREDARWRWLVLLIALSVWSILLRVPAILLLAPLAAGLVLERSPAINLRKASAAALSLLVPAVATMAVLYVIAAHISGGTPHYVASSEESLQAGLHARLLGLFGVLWMFPDAMSEMLTSQTGRFMIFAVGLPAAILVLLGINRQRKQGRWMMVFVLLGYPVILATIAGDWAVRPRYLLPLQPLYVWMALEGLLIVVERIRRRRATWTPAAAALTIIIFVAGSVLINAPRLMRNAVYYSALSWTDRYYDVLRKGNHRELFIVADLINSSPKGVAAARYDKIAMLHYLTGVTFKSLPEDDNFEQTMHLISEDPQLHFLVLDGRDHHPDYVQAVLETMSHQPQWHEVFAGRRYHVLKRQ